MWKKEKLNLGYSKIDDDTHLLGLLKLFSFNFIQTVNVLAILDCFHKLSKLPALTR